MDIQIAVWISLKPTFGLLKAPGRATPREAEGLSKHINSYVNTNNNWKYNSATTASLCGYVGATTQPLTF